MFEPDQPPAARSAPPPVPSAPATLQRQVQLFDGTLVTIRTVRPGDGSMMSAFIATLSEEARYFRFKKQFQVASERLQHFLVDVDNMRHVALVCTIERDGREEEIGEARYVVNPDDRSCEFGIAIADAWQGTGLAGRLMGALEELARARGLQSIEGFVASVNRKMLRFMRARGYDVCADPHDPHSVRVVKPLA